MYALPLDMNPRRYPCSIVLSDVSAFITLVATGKLSINLKQKTEMKLKLTIIGH